jgi:dipeptidyl aminopeptidase/acylaminoacyl peptidase
MEGGVCVLVRLVERRLALGLVSVAVLVVSCAGAGSAWASFPGRNGSIVYGWVGESAYRAGPTASSIRAVEPTSGIVRVLRDCPLRFGPPSYTDCNVGSPRYSPDGQTIAFTTIHTTPDFTGGPWRSEPGLATMGSDGTALQEHGTQYTYRGPAWAPSGDRLLLQRDLPVPDNPRPTALFLATLDGTELDQVAPAWSSGADWSSRGQIAYVRDRNADPACLRSCLDIFITRLGGTPRRLTYRGGSAPSWSPHGTKLAFIRRTGSDPGIYLVRRDGSGLRRLTRRGVGPVWSPNGRWIAFVRYGDLYVIRTNGRGLRRLVDSPYSGLDCPCVGSVDWQALEAVGLRE